MLRISKVTRRFGNKTAVDAVDLEIPNGQMVGIIGAVAAPSNEPRPDAAPQDLASSVRAESKCQNCTITFDGLPAMYIFYCLLRLVARTLTHRLHVF
jgi:hypothetical protein